MNRVQSSTDPQNLQRGGNLELNFGGDGEVKQETPEQIDQQPVGKSINDLRNRYNVGGSPDTQALRQQPLGGIPQIPPQSERNAAKLEQSLQPGRKTEQPTPPNPNQRNLQKQFQQQPRPQAQKPKVSDKGFRITWKKAVDTLKPTKGGKAVAGVNQAEKFFNDIEKEK